MIGVLPQPALQTDDHFLAALGRLLGAERAVVARPPKAFNFTDSPFALTLEDAGGRSCYRDLMNEP